MEYTYYIGLNPIETSDVRLKHFMNEQNIKGFLPIFESEQKAKQKCYDAIKITTNNPFI